MEERKRRMEKNEPGCWRGIAIGSTSGKKKEDTLKIVF